MERKKSCLQDQRAFAVEVPAEQQQALLFIITNKKSIIYVALKDSERLTNLLFRAIL